MLLGKLLIVFLRKFRNFFQKKSEPTIDLYEWNETFSSLGCGLINERHISIRLVENFEKITLNGACFSLEVE